MNSKLASRRDWFAMHALAPPFEFMAEQRPANNDWTDVAQAKYNAAMIDFELRSDVEWRWKWADAMMRACPTPSADQGGE